MNLPAKCPSCGEKLIVAELCCSECATTVKGRFELPELARLNEEERRFLGVFLSARGSMKEVGGCLGISYPTVKARLEALLSRLGLDGVSADPARRRSVIVKKLEKGDIPFSEAVELLKAVEREKESFGRKEGESA